MVKEADTYRTIAKPSEGLFKDKGSKFIAYLLPVTSEDDVKDILLQIKKEHFSARHHCYAYRLGYHGERYRVYDDGEPSGTAGKPIYGQLLSNEITNALVVVVRYFGGTLLGVSGLINAYKSAAIDAIDKAQVISKIIENRLLLRFGYPIQNQIMRVIKDEQIEIVHADFGMECILQITVRLSKLDMINKKLKTIIGLTVEQLDYE